MVGKVEETLDPVQGHFGLQEAIDHPREVVERKNEHAYQCQGREYLRLGGRTTVWLALWMEEQGSSRTEGLAGQSLDQSWQRWPFQES